jgi:FAD/FMN-containing dehydrogenase
MIKAMKELVKNLRTGILGTATDSPDALKYFSTDGSVFQIMPKAVVYPKNAADVVTTVKYLSGVAAGGHPVNLTARGKGTDQAGGALGDGVMMVFPAHMNKLINIHKDTVTVQPGILYGTLQKILHTHGRFLPPYPSSIEFSTIGGAVANNACGEKTIKYGATRDFVKSLKVVLADGSVIETRRITARELNHKKGQATLEGEIYRAVDNLIVDNAAIIRQAPPHTSKNASGYALWRVKDPDDGSFDLSQLFVGSQGTLGVVTEITLKTMPYNPKTTLAVGYFDSLEKAGQAILKLESLKPSAMEIVDENLLKFLKEHQPESIEGLIPDEIPKIVVLTEFDDQSQLRQRIRSGRTQRIYKKYAVAQRTTTILAEQEALWKIRHSAAAVIWMTQGKQKALPIIEDGCVPVEKMPEFLEKVYKLLNKHKLQIAVWGHGGDANFHMQPFMDLGKTSDRTKLFKVADEFYNLVLKMGGTICGEHNDGLMRAPYVQKLYGKEMYELFRQTKKIFDPYHFLNTRVKLDVTQEDLKGLLRHEYSMEHLYDHMPHT